MTEHKTYIPTLEEFKRAWHEVYGDAIVLPPYYPEDKSRDRRIVEAIRDGNKISVIAAHFGISESRVRQIVKRSDRAP